MIRSPLITVMVQAVRKAGRALARDFGEVENLQVSLKGPANFVSSADRKAEETLFAELSRARPGYGFNMEERGRVAGTDEANEWVVDPLDGTTNFLHGIPIFAISLALLRNGVPFAGVIFNPVTDELYVAEKGQGAYLNDRRLRVAARRKLADSVVGCGIPHLARGDHQKFQRELSLVQGQVAGVRRTGAAAIDLAWVAAGRFDAFWERDLSAWDMAAGMIIIREAGGYVSDLDGGDKSLDNGHIIAGNENIREDLFKLLKKA
ncbi:inositol monophosphatase [Azorhizobium oxalatiphilum]|uniref:Inositol-1-monophosphatase n=1 Tax=Azorhizobium oxalatiphilum TaxID=980631 RepID=A0A917BGT7_9HYPH|nr:inositol monophosphatase family protein [Azorhizobium oxalatiphilum]GGF44612.1 inositol monophosphatase [Azorhizobium oxalatiphilum]